MTFSRALTVVFPPVAESRAAARVHVYATAALLFVIGLLAYSNAWRGPFLLDDQGSIIDNPTLRDLRSAAVFRPPANAGVGGRPIANLTLAFNYAGGQLAPGGYHATNLAIHLLVGLTLFGVVRRTLTLPTLRNRFGTLANTIAATAAALWLLHPLQTIVVDYVSQRTESLMALFYLLTLYCFVRGTTSARPTGWFAAMLVACLLGAGSKEIIVTAPLAVLWYDRTFVAGSIRAAWRAHWRWYLTLAATWIPLGWSMRDLHERGAGLELGIAPWLYALNSCRALLTYLRLSVWPSPLVFDYGPQLEHHVATLVPAAALVLLLLVATGIVIARQPAFGFGLGWFLLVLAPTTTVVPIAFQPLAENRVYLPLAGLLTVCTAASFAWLGRRAILIGGAAAVAFAGATLVRNRVLTNSVAVWTDTLQKRPANLRAQTNLGFALVDLGRPAEAIPHFELVVRAEPNNAEAHSNLGDALARTGQLPAALRHFERAMTQPAPNARLRCNYGETLLRVGRLEEARTQFTTVLRRDPANSRARLGLLRTASAHASRDAARR